MSAAASSSSMLGNYLELFAQTEIFIFVFMEIVTKTDTIQRAIFKKGSLKDYIVFIVIFGLFSIFGTYIGTVQSSGAITNIRDLAPIVAGLVAGPYVGLAVGLIGGVHRFFLGGPTYIPCSLATILAGLIAGLVYRLNKGKLLGIVPAILFGVAIESMHGGLALLIVQPYSVALAIVIANIPQMMVAVSLGAGISVIIIHSTKEAVRAEGKNWAKESAPREVGFPREVRGCGREDLKRLHFLGCAHASAREAQEKVSRGTLGTDRGA
jgi:sigma-B regulation protein RsbU (phosphoserine phosphatase)